MIPKERMKARSPHRVPLSARCLDILKQARQLKPESTLIFEASKRDRPLSDMTFTKHLRDTAIDATPHGCRSSFKRGLPNTPRRSMRCPKQLLHCDPSKVVAAYLRTDFLAERRPLMDQWAAHCTAFKVAA
jgi:integrase